MAKCVTALTNFPWFELLPAIVAIDSLIEQPFSRITSGTSVVHASTITNGGSGADSTHASAASSTPSLSSSLSPTPAAGTNADNAMAAAGTGGVML